MVVDCFYICLACFLFGLVVGFFVHKYEYGEREGIDTEFLRKYDNDNGTVIVLKNLSSEELNILYDIIKSFSTKKT